MKRRPHPLLLVLFFIGMAAFGGYHLIRIPIDIGQQSGLANARPCPGYDTGDCIIQVPATVTDVIYHRRSPDEIVVQLSDGSFHTIGMFGASWSALVSLRGTPISLARWESTYVWADTNAGRIRTSSHPSSQLQTDAVIGGMSLLGAVAVYIAWRRGRRKTVKLTFSNFPISAA